MTNSSETVTRKPISIWSILLILFFIYFLFRLYCYLVPTDNVTLHFAKDSCGIAEIAKGSIEQCSLTGSLRKDLYSNGYILDLKDGTSLYIHQNNVKALSYIKE